MELDETFSMYLEKNPKPTISCSHRALPGKTKLPVRNCLLFSEEQQVLVTELFQYVFFVGVYWQLFSVGQLRQSLIARKA